MIRSTLLLVFLIVAACRAESPGVDSFVEGREGVIVEGAWARPVTVGESERIHSAAYFRLQNFGEDQVTLVDAATDVAGRTEIHETQMEDGVMRMRQRSDVSVPGGESVAFEPGGLHIMLMEVHRDLVEGDTLMLTLRFADSSEQEVSVAVRTSAP